MILKVDTRGETRLYTAYRAGLSGRLMPIATFSNDSVDKAERKAAAKAWCLELKPPSADRLYLQKLAEDS